MEDLTTMSKHKAAQEYVNSVAMLLVCIYLLLFLMFFYCVMLMFFEGNVSSLLPTQGLIILIILPFVWVWRALKLIGKKLTEIESRLPRQ